MRTILIADDERTIREGIAAAVNWEMLGISRVLLAADGREAYDIILAERPDIAIVDIKMPEMTGIEVISRVSGGGGGTKFVIISGYGEFDYAREAIRYHVKNYILKPLDIGEITETLQEILADLEAQRSMQEERLHLQKHIDLLVPQAREQVLREFLTGGPPNGFVLFTSVFGRPAGALRLLLFRLDGAESPASLSMLKRCVDEAAADMSWSCSAIVHDCVVLVFAAEAGTESEEILGRIARTAACHPLAGIRAALSDRGAVEDLPEMYGKAWEAVKSFYPPCTGGTTEPIPLIEASTAHYGRTIQQVMRHVRENLGDASLSLQQIATKVLYLNPEYLGRLFKKACGIKFSDYLMQARMERAKQLIAMAGELKLYEVARQVGLGDNAAYFSQVFRKYTGLLPSEYRARYGTHTEITSFSETPKTPRKT